MKKFLIAAAVVALAAPAAMAQQAVFGTGATSQSITDQGFAGNSASGAGSLGGGIALSSNVQTMAGTQNTAGFGVAGTNIATSGAATGSTTTSNVGIGSTSFSASAGGAGGLAFGGNTNGAAAGSAATAFGGFGVSLP